MVTLLQVLSVLVLLGGLVWGGIKLWSFYEDEGISRREEAKKKPSVWGQGIMSLIGLILVVILFTGGAAQVPATHIGVVENTLWGQFYVLNPGTHIWPFSPNLFPLITKVTQYDLRRQIIEIGADPVKEKGVQADSNSPGRPVVYFWARGWAYPNKDKIIELHRKYGSPYLDDWVERNWVSALKGVQGHSPYDYVGNDRSGMEGDVEETLQTRLLADDGQPLVFVSQLAIPNFAYDKVIDDYLAAVAQKNFERQTAEQQILVNTKNQEAEKISADTKFIVTKRAAEAEQAKRVAEAQGQADALKVVAEAEAYQIKVKYNAEATGIGQVQAALAASPAGFLQYQINTRWNGQLPVYMLGSTPLPFMNIPMSTTVITDTMK